MSSLLRSAYLATCLLTVAAIGAGPASAGENAVKSFWGPPTLDRVSAFPIYKDLGVELYQIQLRWETTARTRPANPRDPADPAYTWPATLDYAIQEAAANGIRVGLMIQGAPPWANGGSQEWSVPPTSDADFAAFVDAAARRYPAVRHWMIWGEVNNRFNFKGSARRYARMLDRAYVTLKGRSRRNLVIGGNTFSGGDTKPVRFVKSLRLANGARPRMDLYGHNPFSRRRPVISNRPSSEGFIAFPDVRRFDRTLQRDLRRPGRPRLRMFMSEYALPTQPNDAAFRTYFVSERTQASYIRHAWRTTRREPSIYGLGWFFLRDVAARPDRLGTFGGLIAPDNRRKPGYLAFKRG